MDKRSKCENSIKIITAHTERVWMRMKEKYLNNLKECHFENIEGDKGNC